MEEVKSRAKWWNNEVMVPSLRTTLCMLSGPGALPRLRNLTILMINYSHAFQQTLMQEDSNMAEFIDRMS